MKIKVSIIIPIFNAGEYLFGCINSVISQTLKDIEIIFIIDAPTDGSAEVALSFAKKDKRIKVIINEVNKNIGVSRNEGIQAASGEYLAFVDHDDYVHLEMYETLYNKAVNENSDIVLGADIVVSDGVSKHIDVDFLRGIPNERIKELALRDLLLWGENQQYTSKICNIHPNLYRREFIVNKDINFVDTNFTSAEDYLFQLESIALAENITFSNIPFYSHQLYSKSEGSNYSYRSYGKRLSSLYVEYSVLKKNNLLKEYEKYFSQGVSKVYLTLLIGTLRFGNGLKDFSHLLLKIKKIQHSEFGWNIPFSMKSIPWKAYSFTGKLERFFLLIILKML